MTQSAVGCDGAFGEFGGQQRSRVAKIFQRCSLLWLCVAPLFATLVPTAIAFDDDEVNVIKYFNTSECRAWRENTVVHDMDLVMLPQLQAVFVDNVKVASTQMRHAFQSIGGTWYRSKGSAQKLRDKNAVPVQLTQDSKRTHAADLPQEVWDTYTFFSFVRDPLSRFASGHAQAMAAGGENVNETWTSWFENPHGRRSPSGKKTNMRHVPGSSLQEILGALEAGTFINEHYQSQLWRLTPNRKMQGPSVPLHFVGRLETFAESWKELLELIQKRSTETPGLAVEQGAIDKITRAVLRKGKANSRKASTLIKKEIHNDATMHKRIEQLYSSDYDCFGFQRKYERPDVTPTLELAQFNYRYSWWHKYPRAYKGPANEALRPNVPN